MTNLNGSFGGQASTNQVVLRKWKTPPQGVRQADSTKQELEILFDKLPTELATFLLENYGDHLENLNEIYLQLGLIPECIFADPQTGQKERQAMGDFRCSDEHIDMFASFFLADENGVSSTKRKGISGTLHRISLVTHPLRSPEKVLGVAVRVGRSLSGLLETMAWENFLLEMAREQRSLLIIGRPGFGKTTVLREVARILSQDAKLNVVVVDKTCEIAGDGDTPHPAIGNARWMPVGRPNLQHVIMREAVENQSPDVIIVDEISTALEVEAAKTIAQRGVQLIATVHGQTLPEILNCKERGSLVGGVATMTLSSQEADRRADKRKQVQVRAKEPVFRAALELHCRDKWVFHPNIKDAVDTYFQGEAVDATELHPGMAVSVKALPREGHFEYSQSAAAQSGFNLFVPPVHVLQQFAIVSTEAHATAKAPGQQSSNRRRHKRGIN